MRFVQIARAAALCLGILTSSSPARAAPRVEMTIGTEQGLPVSATQQWYRLLTELGVDRLRIRSRRPGEEPAVNERQANQPSTRRSSTTYEVTGVLNSRNLLLLPGGKFTSRDAGQLKAWLAKIREGGAAAVAQRGPLPFGMSADQLAEVQDDLAAPLGFSTTGLSPGAVIEKAGAELSFPLTVDPAAANLLAGAPRITEELRLLSTGTVIAYLLRGSGLSLVPSRSGRPSTSYRVRRTQPRQEAWPVGWKPKQRRTELAPELFELLTVELDDIPVAQVLDAISERVRMPVLWDHYALALHGIDPASARVSLPEKRTSYSVALRLALGQARLKSELRVDDAGRPFLWVTTFKPAN